MPCGAWAFPVHAQPHQCSHWGPNPLGTKPHVHLLPETEGRCFPCETGFTQGECVLAAEQEAKGTPLAAVLSGAIQPWRIRHGFGGLFLQGKRWEGRNGNCSAFVFLPRKRVRSENRRTNWLSCPAPLRAEAGAGPGKKHRPLGTGGGRQGPGSAQSCDTG